MSYLQQLKAHRESLELTVKQCDNDIAHNNKCIELLKQQKGTIQKQIEYINGSIEEEEKQQP
jgi:septal ring factor EnvC (AmiA/AmiB activator)